ncbi:hypothetical protein [Aeromicrobium sp. Leaf350]|uniref:hypothetical protein n=1 Tax=Aeromicrobium sp. Leaf350 TaxID=2876565 RepID=UPI001E3AFE69|nr:hypothetical protein [Aeromicrobium sp. Leaf350]
MTTTVPTEIASFAASVRAALADLPAEEVEELTEGLEADLAEAFREDLARELGDPEVYAVELRTAAGLPAPEPTSRRSSVVDKVRDLGRDTRSLVSDHPVLERTVDFVVSLRPAWWLLRAWAAWVLVGGVLGTGGGLGSLVVLVLFAIGSVALGLGRWPGWVTGIIVAGNVAAAVVVLAMLAYLPSSFGSSYTDGDSYASADLTGVYLDGQQVTNIFAYGADGQPLSDVQLFDQDGRPLATSVPGGNGCLDPDCVDLGLWAPMTLVTGQPAYNVYPMSMVEAYSDDYGTLRPVTGATAVPRPSPFLQVPALTPAG